MNKLIFLTFALAGMLGASAAKAEGDLFTGDVRLACEAVLCLASGTQPSECAPSLKRYFSIRHTRLSDTVKARKKFLSMCPASNQDDGMRALVNDIANGAGRCDAASLNASGMVWNEQSGTRTVQNQVPGHCAAYHNNPYTDLGSTGARYVGTPERGGYWVDAANHEQALREHDARSARGDEPYSQQYDGATD